MERLHVGILGATGAVGQQFIALLDEHPWFEVTALAASDRSAGKQYREAVQWILATPMPERIATMSVQECQPNLDCDFVFSALDTKVAGDIEWDFASHGIPVISNTRNYRHDPLVPLLIPEVNPEHIHLIPAQRRQYGFADGFIATNPNCAVTGLVLGLLPIWRRFGIKRMVVTTLQAISGAGYPGVASLDILNNVLPNIAGEVEKIQSEPQKIFGKFEKDHIRPADLQISAQCNRVPVRNGHLVSVSLELAEPAEQEAIASVYREFRSPLAEWHLPSAPLIPVRFVTDTFEPQPLRDLGEANNMIVTVGQLQPCPVLSYRLVILVHNTIRGAAGGAILNAEWLKVNDYLKHRA